MMGACSETYEPKEVNNLSALEDKKSTLQYKPEPNPDRNAYFCLLYTSDAADE